MSREQMKARLEHLAWTVNHGAEFPLRDRAEESIDDQRRLHAALDAVEALTDYWATLAEGDRYYARRIREAIRDALGEDS